MQESMDAKKKEKLFMREFFRKVGKAIYDYQLIEEGDVLLVGVSGGKDSLALLELLGASGAACGGNFDDLMIPFRCIVTDVNAHSPVERQFSANSCRGCVRIYRKR